MAYLTRPLRSMRSTLGLCLIASCAVSACGNTGPGAGVRWTSYPSLASSTTSVRWLVVKCQLSNVAAIPANFDTQIAQFFGITGAGYGNMVDYFHDVSYNRVSVVSDTFIGWVRAPFSSADLMWPNGRLRQNRGQRVKECLEAIPTDQRPDLEDFYGVVVVNNAQQDGGSCWLGQATMNVNNKNYQLACQWFDNQSLSTQFAAHEFGHGFGLDDSYDDSQGSCGGDPGRYCDPWDIMSAQNTYQFADPNFTVAGGGPGMSAPGLLKLNWIPSNNQRQFNIEAGEQRFTLRALSRARGSEPLVVVVNVGGAGAFDGIYTVEYRQGDGWDRGFVTGGAPANVVASGGTVMVHEYRPAGAPVSKLLNGRFAAALQPCNTLVLPGFGGTVYHVTVDSFNISDGSAQVSVGSGRGKYTPCFRDTIDRDFISATRSHSRFNETIKP